MVLPQHFVAIKPPSEYKKNRKKKLVVVGAKGSSTFVTLYKKVLVGQSFLHDRGWRGSNNLPICVTSFMDDPKGGYGSNNREKWMSLLAHYFKLLIRIY